MCQTISKSAEADFHSRGLGHPNNRPGLHLVDDFMPAEMVEQGATEGDIQMLLLLMAVAESINIAMIIAVMHDHAAGEDKLIDLLEEEIVKWNKLNVAGYADLSEAEQDNLSHIIRGYCFDHKIYNLGKAIARGLGDFCTAGEFLLTDACSKTRHTPPKATTWIHACHKLIGRKHCKAGGVLYQLLY